MRCFEGHLFRLGSCPACTAMIEGARVGRAIRPATRIGRTVVFEGGRTVRLSLLAWALCAAGIKRMVKTP